MTLTGNVYNNSRTIIIALISNNGGIWSWQSCVISLLLQQKMLSQMQNTVGLNTSAGTNSHKFSKKKNIQFVVIYYLRDE